MKELEKIIIGKGEVKGYLFTQLQMSDEAYLYKVDTGVSIIYEVFKKIYRTNSIRHCFPTSKAFGIWAYTFTSLKKAIEKFNEINSKKND